MPSSSRGTGAPISLALAAGLFFLSGTGALVVETTWLRWLRPLFGATAPATSATLVAFFTGQALGAAWGARLARRSRHPLASYARLEGAAVVFALAVPFALAAGSAALGPLYDGVRDHTAALTALRFVVALLATLPAAVCFGATLPVLAAAVIEALPGLAARGPALYGANLLGAASGTALAAFVLPDRLGVRAGYGVGLAAIALAAAGAGVLARRRPPRAAREARLEAATAATPARAPRLPAPLLGLAALSGFGSFAAQVLLVQSFSLVLDQSVYAFGVVLVTVLASLAAGSLAVAASAQRGALPAAGLTLGALTAAALFFLAFPTLFVFASDGVQVLRGHADWAGYLGASLGLAAVTAGPALLAAAAVLPAVFGLAAEPPADGSAAVPPDPLAPGARLGELLVANTLGAIAGAIAAPWVLVPVVGLWGAFVAVAGVYALGVVLVPGADRRLRVALPLAVGLALLALRPWQSPVVHLEPGERLVALDQGPAGIVAAVADAKGLRLQTDNHYALGGTAERIHEERQGHLPLLLRPGAARVAYLGSATGISAGAVLAHPVEQLTLVEIVPAVARLAAEAFGEHNRGVYADPRTRVVLDDARNFLRATRERFDVIVADLFVPWRSGTGALYTLEHFRAARERLAPGGLFCQWLPLYQLGQEEFEVLLATFLEVFPEAGLWRGDFYGRFPIVALVGHLGEPAAAAEIERAALDLASAGVTDRWVTDPAGVWALYAGPLAALGRALDEVPRNRDDRPRIEYLAARSRVRGARQTFVGLPLQAFVEQLRRVTEARGDPLHPDLSPAARRAAAGGHALQGAGALFVAGRHRESARALAVAADLLPARLVAAAPADETAAEVWRND